MSFQGFGGICNLETEEISLVKGGKIGHRCLLTPPIKPLVEGSEGHQRCFFNIRYEVDILWEGSHIFVFSSQCLSHPNLTALKLGKEHLVNS